MAPARALPRGAPGGSLRVRRASVAPLRLGSAHRARRSCARRGAGLCTAQENGCRVCSGSGRARLRRRACTLVNRSPGLGGGARAGARCALKYLRSVTMKIRAVADCTPALFV